jgi:CxxC motif-containing protein
MRCLEEDFFIRVRIKGAMIPVLPVRSTQSIPKEKILDCALELANIVVEAPAEAGEIIVKNLLGLEVDIIVTRDIDLAKERLK